MTRMVWMHRMLLVVCVAALGLCSTAPAADGALWEPGDMKLLKTIWPHLANERLMHPLGMQNIAAKVGPERQLFVDNYLIARTSDVTREVHSPRRYKNNPVLTGLVDAKSKLNSSAIVMHVLKFDTAPKFRMWYWSWRRWHPWKDGQQIRFGVSYAVSDDGLHWRRPALNLHQFPGSAEKNVVIPYGLPHGVFHTPWDPDPQRKFKALICVEARKSSSRAAIPEGYYLHTSPDGVHWKGDLTKYVIPSLTNYSFPQPGIGDTTRFWWDPYRKKFIGDVKFVVAGKIRCWGIMDSDDLIHWSRARPTFYARNPKHQIYGHRGYPYQGMYIGMRWIYQPEYDPETHSMDVELDCSRDGHTWTRVAAGQKFLKFNRKRNTWDCSRLKTTSMLEVGDEVWVYYTSAPTAYDYKLGKLPASQRVVSYSAGVARLKRDRFVSLNGANKGAMGGKALTRPLGFSGKTLHINALTLPGGQVRVGLKTWGGEAIKGFGAGDCTPIRGDSIDIPVRWKGGSDVLAAAGSHVRLEFRLKNAKLFSFWFD